MQRSSRFDQGISSRDLAKAKQFAAKVPAAGPTNNLHECYNAIIECLFSGELAVPRFT